MPAAAGNTKRQIKFITDFGTTCLHIIPSYATRLAEVMYEEGIDPRKDTKLHTVCIGAEPHSEEQRKRIEQLLGVKAYNCFGMSEMNGPGVAFECTEQNGLHIWEDNVIVEIVDPVTLQPVPEGEVGELVLTTINRERCLYSVIVPVTLLVSYRAIALADVPINALPVSKDVATI